MKVKGTAEAPVITEATVVIATYNGFTGIGETQEQAEIALDWACSRLPLDGQRITTITYDEMTRNGWN